MPSRPREHEDVEAWRTLTEADFTRLRSLTAAQLAAEVMRRGFDEPASGGTRTRIGLSNSLCPTAPPMVGGDDLDAVQRYSDLLLPVLGALEDAGLLGSETRGRSALRFYSLTARGRSALDEGDVEAVLTEAQ